MNSEKLFVLTEEEAFLQRELRELLATNKEFQEIVEAALNASDNFDENRPLFWRAFNFFRKRGYCGFGLPEEYGGLSASSRSSVILTEEEALLQRELRELLATNKEFQAIVAAALNARDNFAEHRPLCLRAFN